MSPTMTIITAQIPVVSVVVTRNVWIPWWNQEDTGRGIRSKRNQRTRTNRSSTRTNHLNNDLTKTTPNQIPNIPAIMKITTKRKKNQSRRLLWIPKTMLSGIWSSEKGEERKWITWSIAKNSKRRILSGHSRDRTISAISIQATTMRKTTSKAAQEGTSSTAILIKQSQNTSRSQERKNNSWIRMSKKPRKGGMNLWRKSTLLPLKPKRLPKEPT